MLLVITEYLCEVSQFFDRENNDKNNTLPLGKQICLTIVWGCAEILPLLGKSRQKFLLKKWKVLINCSIVVL